MLQNKSKVIQMLIDCDVEQNRTVITIYLHVNINGFMPQCIAITAYQSTEQKLNINNHMRSHLANDKTVT